MVQLGVRSKVGRPRRDRGAIETRKASTDPQSKPFFFAPSLPALAPPARLYNNKTPIGRLGRRSKKGFHGFSIQTLLLRSLAPSNDAVGDVRDAAVLRGLCCALQRESNLTCMQTESTGPCVFAVRFACDERRSSRKETDASLTPRRLFATVHAAANVTR